MNPYKVIEVETEQQIKDLANVSAFTVLGVTASKDNFENIKSWLEEHEATNPKVDLEFHVIKGELMNRVYGLKGDNKYPNDLTIISVTGIDNMKLIMARFDVDGKWLDDVIDNLKERNGEI